MIRKNTLGLVAVALLVSNPAAFAQGMVHASGPYKGIGIGMQGDDQGIQVVSVMPGSPAEKVGVKVGDQLVSIAGISIFDFDVDKMRSITDTAKTVTVVVVRNSEKKTFEIEPVLMNMPGTSQAQPAPGPGGSPR